MEKDEGAFPGIGTRCAKACYAMSVHQHIETLRERGARIPHPESVYIADDVSFHRIASDVTIHPGCRISGADTSIGPGSVLGAEAPVTIENCQLGRNVRLEGGFFSHATFLDGAHMGSGAHVRGGTLIEEQAGGAHAVAFKQTVFFPFVQAGSLINFCDALVAGGTSRSNHTEIGSSYIHFNFTPHQDKATPSLLGDVPRGVMLDQPPIFLGGQGGLVGPARIEFGVVIPAGLVCRQDILSAQELVIPPPLPLGNRPFQPGAYRAIERIVRNNLRFIGNLWALRAWYENVRSASMTADEFTRACWAGALKQIAAALDERLARLHQLAEKMPCSVKIAQNDSRFRLPERILLQQRALIAQWPKCEEILRNGPPASVGAAARERFLEAWSKRPTNATHIEAIAALSAEHKRAGTEWLQAIVDWAVGLWQPG